MLTGMKREVLQIGLIMLVLLALTGFCPFMTNDFANAEETIEIVDEDINYVNYDESIFPEEEDESYINTDDQEDSEDVNDEKSEKKSSKKKKENLDQDDNEDINDSNSESIDESDETENTDKEELDISEQHNDIDSDASEEDVDYDEDSETDMGYEGKMVNQDLEKSSKGTSKKKEDEDIEDMENSEDDLAEDAEDADDEVTESKDEDVESKKEKNEDKNKNESDDENTETVEYNGEFPESYAKRLTELKQEHPTWNFVAADTGMTWKEALDAEDEGTTNFVDPSVDSDQRERSDKTYDGRWYLANRKTIAHYMDPRNFLNEDDIFQFLVQNYEDGAQTTETVEDIIDGSFMEDGNPGGDYDSYAECIADAGAEAGVNPNVLAAMIIMEQGWDGSSLVSGKKDGYKGYYNFYNIGAWTTDSMSSTERGLWYAKGEGEKKTSYGRPWKSPYKAIEGGAEFYHENYISNHQNTYYTKKFNVMNGKDEIGDHQYMTNVSGALDEGKLVKRAYQDNKDLSLTFEIPIYDKMPKKACKLP